MLKFCSVECSLWVCLGFSFVALSALCGFCALGLRSLWVCLGFFLWAGSGLRVLGFEGFFFAF